MNEDRDRDRNFVPCFLTNVSSARSFEEDRRTNLMNMTFRTEDGRTIAAKVPIHPFFIVELPSLADAQDHRWTAEQVYSYLCWITSHHPIYKHLNLSVHEQLVNPEFKDDEEVNHRYAFQACSILPSNTIPYKGWDATKDGKYTFIKLVFRTDSDCEQWKMIFSHPLPFPLLYVHGKSATQQVHDSFGSTPAVLRTCRLFHSSYVSSLPVMSLLDSCTGCFNWFLLDWSRCHRLELPRSSLHMCDYDDYVSFSMDAIHPYPEAEAKKMPPLKMLSMDIETTTPRFHMLEHPNASLKDNFVTSISNTVAVVNEQKTEDIRQLGDPDTQPRHFVVFFLENPLTVEQYPTHLKTYLKQKGLNVFPQVPLLDLLRQKYSDPKLQIVDSPEQIVCPSSTSHHYTRFVVENQEGMRTTVRSYTEERVMLTDWIYFCRAENQVDIHTGFNQLNYDYEYIRQRLVMYGVLKPNQTLPIGRIFPGEEFHSTIDCSYSSTQHGTRSLRIPDIHGNIVDVFVYASGYKMNKYTLAAVAEKFLKGNPVISSILPDSKVDYPYYQMYEDYWCRRYDRQLEYVQVDSILPFCIMVVMLVISSYRSTCNNFKTTLQDIYTSGSSKRWMHWVLSKKRRGRHLLADYFPDRFFQGTQDLLLQPVSIPSNAHKDYWLSSFFQPGQDQEPLQVYMEQRWMNGDYYDPQWIFNQKRSDRLLQLKANHSKIILPPKIPFEAGKVLDPTPGLFSNCFVLDFASLYPTVVMAYHLCFSSIVFHPNQITPEELSSIHDTISTEMEQQMQPNLPASMRFSYLNYCRWLGIPNQRRTNQFDENRVLVVRFARDKAPFLVLQDKVDTVFPEAQRWFREKRTSARQLMEKALQEGDQNEADRLEVVQLSLKLDGNSGYGVSAIICLPLSVIITCLGRYNLDSLENFMLREYKLYSKYGDTDSVMVVPDQNHYKDMTKEELLPYILRACKHFDETCLIRPMQIEAEKMMHVLFCKAKKRYAAFVWPINEKQGTFSSQPSFMSKGFIDVRRGTSQFSREQVSLFLKTLLEKDIHVAWEQFRENVSRITETPIEKFVCSKALKKHLVQQLPRGQANASNAYLQPTSVHIRIATEMFKRDPSRAPVPGSRISYVMVQKPEQKHLKWRSNRTLLGEELSYFLENKDRRHWSIHYEYYFSELVQDIQQVCSIMIGEQRTRLQFRDLERALEHIIQRHNQKEGRGQQLLPFLPIRRSLEEDKEDPQVVLKKQKT